MTIGQLIDKDRFDNWSVN